jgi:predicted O-methyltransferase YrrM
MATKHGFEGTYWITEAEWLLLFRLVRSVPGDYLEIGSFDGIVATEIAQKYPNRKIHCVDLFHGGHATDGGHRETFEANMARHHVANLRIFEGDSRTVVPALPQNYGVILVDGDHAYATVLADLRNSWAKLSAQGLLVFHDYGQIADVTRAVDEFLSEQSLEIALRVDSMGCVAGSQFNPCKLKFLRRWIRFGLRFRRTGEGLRRYFHHQREG